MLRLSETLMFCLVALLSPLSWQPASATCSGFDRVDGAMDCVRPEFYRVLSGVCGVEPCALVCAPMASCKAFTPLPQCQCKLFLFDACSHRVQSMRDGCSVHTTVYIRQLSGAAPGRLCPAGFSKPWYGTSYKVVNSPTATWSDAKVACSSAGGLAKFADALDASETQWLMSLRSGGVSYFVGGHQTVANTKDLMANWIWDACNATVDRSLWQPGEPSSGLPNQGCVCLYTSYTAGLDDYFCTQSLGYICECQSVFI